ncbi:type IV toxin-antitoxin system AbiEi family antitoxin domain-containing protein [Oceanivirga salmonicida]|uniref:type IV toxin-antitoxin system AbiEi family antitoxin domain-containing protein n=1 Tax=Oceanivirga salmonicida TaxID=1769291 RepID=UPI00082D93AC|nr:type IV toxin-antitoxin system AbiEi family antitoxin domain-containing protein [Oceanivirga salmonicida]
MKYKEKIINYLEKSGGIITSKYCVLNEIPSVYLTRLVRDNILKKISQGIYVTENADFDELYFFQLRYKKTIFSYYTALYLLGLSDKIIQNIDVTVESGYKFNEIMPNVNIKYVKKSLFKLGVIEVETMFGNKVRTYCFERIICDFIKNKNNIDIEIYAKIIRKYINYKNKNLELLYEIASKMGILKEVMEIYYE